MAGTLNLPVSGCEQEVTCLNRNFGFSNDRAVVGRGSVNACFQSSLGGKKLHYRGLFSCQPWNRTSAPMQAGCPISMTLLDQKQALDRDVGSRQSEILVRWDSVVSKPADIPTAVLLHGILGSRKNWEIDAPKHDSKLQILLQIVFSGVAAVNRDVLRSIMTGAVGDVYDLLVVAGSFARRLAREFPMWQFLLVDLRCHGDSAPIKKSSPHTVASTALDVLKLVGKLKLTPRILVGHSFGGKVALSMVDQAAKPLARPVKVWVLDATPGKVRPGGDGEDHPAELITCLSKMTHQLSSKQMVVNGLLEEGFSNDIAQWVATNLRPNDPTSLPSSCFSWIFDLNGISEMYESYEETNLWRVDDVPEGVHVNFLKAERSLHRWALEDIQRIHAAEEMAAKEGAGIEMHVLEDAGLVAEPR